MTSQKQIEANQKNAKRSTGPKSNEGKAIVARNAIRHGILSEYVPVDETEFDLYSEYCEVMLHELEPRGNLQSLLADRVISTGWRLRRVVHVESLMLQKAHDSSYTTSYMDAFVGSSANHMAILSRYERSLENALFRALKEFRALKDEHKSDIFSFSI